MAELELTQSEADALLAMEKHCSEETRYDFPSMGGKLIVPLISADRRENFFLDIRRGRIDLAKGTYQNRARQVIVLARIDFGGKPHRNPDDEEISCPHLHLYREGYGDKWAVPVPPEKFALPLEPWRTLNDFMSYCNVTKTPDIERGLFT